MTLDNLCSLFDEYEVVDTQIQIDSEYYSSSEVIYSDGEIISGINGEGYIHIKEVHNANYIMFVTIGKKLYICLYKYIPEVKYKEIIGKLNILKKSIGEIAENCEHIEKEMEEDRNRDKNEFDDLININEFKCQECDSNEKMIFSRSKTNPDALETKCNKCKTEYTFVPSKYYRMSSKKIIYFKSDLSSRQIDINENKKEGN